MSRIGPMRGFIAAGIVATILGATAHGPAPSATQIVAKVRPGHPRLLLDASTIAELRSELSRDPWLADRYRRQKKRADRSLAEPVSEYHLAGENGLLATSRRVLERVTA